MSTLISGNDPYMLLALSECCSPPRRTELPQEEGTAAAYAAADEAHRAAKEASRRLAARESAEARTPRVPPTRNLNMLDVV